MHNGRTFPYRPRAAKHRWGDGEGYAGGVLDVPVKARRARAREIRPAWGPRRETKPRAKPQSPRSREKPLGRPAGARTKTDTGGRVEHTEAIGATMVKELGTLDP